MSHSCKLIETKRGSGWNLQSVAGWSEAQLTAWNLGLRSGVEGEGQPYGMAPLTYGIWADSRQSASELR